MTHNMTCAITDGYRPNDVDTVEGEAMTELDAIEASFRIDVEIARRKLREQFSKYVDDLGLLTKHGPSGDFDLSGMLDRIEDVMLDEFYAAKRQAEGGS